MSDVQVFKIPMAQGCPKRFPENITLERELKKK